MPRTRRISGRWLAGVLAIIAATLLARPLLAADFSGTWEISYRVGQETEIIVLDVIQRRSTVSGTGSVRGASAGDVVPVEIRAGWVSARRFRFQLAGVADSGARPQSFFGDWYRDEASGRTDGAFGSRMFAGVRRLARD